MRRLLLAILVSSIPVIGWAGEFPLLDGVALERFQHPNGDTPRPGWSVDNGVIHLDSKQGKRIGDLITQCDFCDFRLSFDWKVPPGGNNGIKYRVRQYKGRWLGCEYQMTDDEHFKMRPDSKSSSGALYAVYGPDAERKVLKPVGEYNHGQIVVRGSQIEHWLNGECIVSATVGSFDWLDRVASSKFRDEAGFSQNRRGRIMLTDHSSEVWFRNVRLEILPTIEYCDSLPARACTSTTSCCKPSTGGQRRTCSQGNSMGRMIK